MRTGAEKSYPRSVYAIGFNCLRRHPAPSASPGFVTHGIGHVIHINDSFLRRSDCRQLARIEVMPNIAQLRL